MDFYLARRVHGLTLLGIMGEAPKLTPAESRAVVRRALARVAGRVPVVVGVSNAELGALAALANDAMAAGAAGVMVAPAPGLAGDAALVDYMASVFAALDPATPVVYQDYPQATGVPLTVEVFHRMVEAFPRLVMLKHEDCPGLTKLGRIRAETARAGRRRVSVLVGNNAIYYPQELARGADGAMTGFSYPEMLVEVYERFIAGDAEGAEDVFDVYLPLLRYEAQPAPGARPPRRTTRAPAQGLSARSSAQFGAITSTTVRHSTSVSTGFARCARKPAASAMSRGCWPANAVTATAGTSRVFRCRATSRTSQ